MTVAFAWTAIVENPIRGSLDLALTLFPLRQGRDDPTLRLDGGTALRALRTAAGPATVEMRHHGDRLRVRATGPGALEAQRIAPMLAGLVDDPDALVPAHPAVREALRRAPGLRLSAGTATFDALLWSVLAQKVVGLDARRSYRDLTLRLGEPAPGVAGMRLPPAAAVVADTPYWVFHAANVERRRAAVIIDLARRAARLDALATLPAAEATRRLRSLPGIGAWTAAEVVSVTHGDPDALPLGDYHLPNVVSWALAGEPRGDDDRMVELLEPYRGQRGRVARLLVHGGHGAPRWGPPMPRRSIRAL